MKEDEEKVKTSNGKTKESDEKKKIGDTVDG